MARKPSAGDLDYRAEFALRETIDDDMGGTRDEWVTQFIDYVAVKHLRGGESVMQARLSSRNPVVVTIRNSARARLIDSEWQVTLRDRTGITKVYAVREDPRPGEDSAFLEMLAEG